MYKYFYLFYLVFVCVITWQPCFGITRKDHEYLLRPRCTSRCLSREAKRILSERYFERNGTKSSISAKDVMKNCAATSERKDCYLCLRPCQRLFSDVANCMELCNGEINCMYSCAFLSDMSQDKMGYCSAPTDFDFAVRVTYWASNSSYTLTPGKRDRGRNSRSCNSECRTDFDCLSSKKCCNVDCAPACRRAVIRKTWVPCLPTAESVTITEKTNAEIQYAELSWTTKRKNDPCTIYLVQEKSTIAKTKPKFRKYGWNTIHETTDDRIALMHLKHGWWYKYRIAAVNTNGTRGFTKETKPFSLSGDPRPPPSPTRLELSRIRIRSGARYNILTVWKLATDIQSDLPIKGFYITVRNKQKTSKIIKEDRKFVRFTKSMQSSGTVFWVTWITGLRMFIPYEISAASASHWENELLISPRAVNITLQFPPSRPTEIVRNLKINLPFITWNGTVSVNVTWDFWYTEAPADLVRFRLCLETVKCYSGNNRNVKMWTIEARKFYLLNELDFACEYEVTVQALYGTFRHQASQVVSHCFRTPPCGLKHELVLTGTKLSTDVAASCPTANKKKNPIYFTRFHFYQILKLMENERYSAELQWSPPRYKSTYETVFLYICFDDNTPLQWIYLPVKETSCILRSLPPSRGYIIRFVTVSRGQAELTSTHYLSTPGLPKRQISQQ
uniref:anosmin-1-like n=1 Tax=Styela clava TaxID=7725 RepID=UPI00193AAE3E|nr:anosmin-1-like [Styela clava]